MGRRAREEEAPADHPGRLRGRLQVEAAPRRKPPLQETWRLAPPRADTDPTLEKGSLPLTNHHFPEPLTHLSSQSPPPRRLRQELGREDTEEEDTKRSQSANSPKKLATRTLGLQNRTGPTPTTGEEETQRLTHPGGWTQRGQIIAARLSVSPDISRGRWLITSQKSLTAETLKESPENVHRTSCACGTKGLTGDQSTAS